MADTVDASIPLSGRTGFDVPKMLEVADLAGQMKQRQVAMQNQNALSQLLANPQSYDPSGNLNQNAMRLVTAANPQVGIELKNQSINEQLRKAQETHYQTEQGQKKFDFMSGIAGVATDAYTEAKKTGANDQQAIAAATRARNDALDASGGMLSSEDIQNSKGHPWDPIQSKAFASMNKEWIAGSRASEVATMAERHADTAEAQEREREKMDRARIGVEAGELGLRREELDWKKKGGGTKPPAGFEWDPDHPDTLRPITGGPKDPNSRPWTGREKVYAERIMGSAVQGAQAIQNITELPIGATSGFLGVNAHPGTGIFSAPFSALKQKATSQEVQDYNTMTLGLKRNLAAIESMGLSPPGSLTEGMDAVIMREGDTNLTKLRRLAEARQVVENGLTVPLNDPAIPDVLKGVMRATIDKTKEAVPYTQHDITELEKAARTNPKASLTDLMAEKGLKKPKLDVPPDIQKILDKHAGPAPTT
jgi:hypothetical protein